MACTALGEVGVWACWGVHAWLHGWIWLWDVCMAEHACRSMLLARVCARMHGLVVECWVLMHVFMAELVHMHVCMAEFGCGMLVSAWMKCMNTWDAACWVQGVRAWPLGGIGCGRLSVVLCWHGRIAVHLVCYRGGLFQSLQEHLGDVGGVRCETGKAGMVVIP